MQETTIPLTRERLEISKSDRSENFYTNTRFNMVIRKNNIETVATWWHWEKNTISESQNRTSALPWSIDSLTDAKEKSVLIFLRLCYNFFQLKVFEIILRIVKQAEKTSIAWLSKQCTSARNSEYPPLSWCLDWLIGSTNKWFWSIFTPIEKQIITYCSKDVIRCQRMLNFFSTLLLFCT